MNDRRLEEIASWRSSPLTSKTMWTIYVAQASLAALGWQYLRICEKASLGPSSTVILGMVCAVAALGIVGVAGISWVDSAERVAKRALHAPPAPAALKEDA